MNIEQYKILHQSKKSYGSTSIDFINEIGFIIDYLKPKTILDFGCGKGALLKTLKKIYPEINIYGYDPAMFEFKDLKIDKADLIINTDVLEHIPECELENVVKKISEISKNVFFSLHHRPANNMLPNGENAHCTIKSPLWYKKLLEKYFDNLTFLKNKNETNTVAVTFEINDDFLKKYNSYMESFLKKRINKLKLKTIFYKIIYNFMLGNTRKKKNIKSIENYIWKIS